MIDLDATVVICHSEQEHATPTFKMTFLDHLHALDLETAWAGR